MMETVRKNSIIASSKSREASLATMKQLIEEFLKKDIACSEVREYLEKVKADDNLLASYLSGRKNDPDIAWDTMLRYAENRFQYYPEVFHDTILDRLRPLIESHVLGILKNTDKLGRKILFFDVSKWDISKFSIEDIIIIAVAGAEKFWRRPEVLKNGVIYIENVQGFSMAHARTHTISHVMKVRDVFLYSFPVAIKGFFYLNMPYLFALACRMCRPLFPKKILSRMHLYSSKQTPNELYDTASLDILPTWAGGNLSTEEAAEDMSFYE